MKNNINNLISEELQKAALLFNYDPKKTLSENIVEQTVGVTSGTTASGTTASGTTSGTTASGTTSANELVYDYFYKQDKNYRYALTSDGKWFAKNIKNNNTFDLSLNPKFKKTIDNLNKGLENGQTKKHTFAANDPKNKVGELKLDTKIKLPTTKDLSAASGSGVTSGSTGTNNGIVDSSTPENKTPVQGQIQSTVSDDEEV
jgi:hypothetical protein